jgi:hypothetical protein
VSTHRHRARSGAPLSTKLAIALGLAFVVGGFGLAGWQRLAEGSDEESAPPAASMLSTHLPGARSVAVFALAIAAAVIAGAFVFIRSRGRGGY